MNLLCNIIAYRDADLGAHEILNSQNLNTTTSCKGTSWFVLWWSIDQYYSNPITEHCFEILTKHSP
jgi:hypothetical protein